MLGRPLAEDLPELVTETGNKVEVLDLLRVSPDHADAYLCEAADWQALVGHQHGLAKMRVGRLTDKLREVEAAVFIEVFNSKEKITMELVRHYVTVDERVKIARKKLQVAQERETALESLKWAMQTRIQMLIQLNADMRAEKKLQ